MKKPLRIISVLLILILTILAVTAPAYAETTEPDTMLIGDADGDGRISATDATYVLQCAAGIISENTEGFYSSNADVDGDGKISATDATYVLQYAAGLISKFPNERNHIHSYSSEITKSATCTKDGTKTFTCSCGDSYTETIPATGHNYELTDEITLTYPVGNDTIQMTSSTYTCSNCYDEYKNNKREKVIEGHTHEYEIDSIRYATCTDKGSVFYLCSLCEDGYTLTIPPTGHLYDSEVTKEAGCETTGTKTYTCSACKKSYTETIPAKGHSWKTSTVHHDAVTGTREVTETWIHSALYDEFHLTKAGFEANLNRYTYLNNLSSDSDLYKAIMDGTVGDHDEMAAADPLFAKRFPAEDSPCIITGCYGHFYLKEEEFLYKKDNPIVLDDLGKSKVDVDDDERIIYLYSPLVPFNDTISNVSGWTLEGDPIKDLIMTDQARRKKMSMEEYGNDHRWSYYQSYIFGNWSFYPVSVAIEKVATETYEITAAYDETATTCSVCGIKE